jgi:hypothetical protein
MSPKKTKLTASTKVLVERLLSQLLIYQQDLENLDLRGRVLKLLEVHEGINKLGIALAVETGLSSSSARKRIKGYLLRYKDEIIEADELSVISGILEYGRRVRELRNEGINILTGPAKNPSTGRPLRPNQYLLTD